jgi:hypothetical protein
MEFVSVTDDDGAVAGYREADQNEINPFFQDKLRRSDVILIPGGPITGNRDCGERVGQLFSADTRGQFSWPVVAEDGRLRSLSFGWSDAEPPLELQLKRPIAGGERVIASVRTSDCIRLNWRKRRGPLTRV